MEEEITLQIKNDNNAELKNRRNGYRTRIIYTIFGEYKLRIPRDRLGHYFPTFIGKYCRETIRVACEIIKIMHEEGTQAAAIRDILRRANIKLPRTLVRRLWKLLAECSKQIYEQRKLKSHYDALIADGTYVWVAKDENGNIKTWETINTYTGEKIAHTKATKVCVLTIYGIDLETNEKTDLGFKIAESETIEAYTELFESAKMRGLETIDLLIADKNKAIRTAVENCFGNVKFQQCFAHASRELKAKVTGREIKKELCECLQAVKYKYNDLDEFINKVVNDIPMSPYMKGIIFDWFANNWETLTTFHQYPPKVWKTIYISNYIESKNKTIKSLCKTKGCNYSVTTLANALYVCKTNNR